MKTSSVPVSASGGDEGPWCGTPADMEFGATVAASALMIVLFDAASADGVGGWIDGVVPPSDPEPSPEPGLVGEPTGAGVPPPTPTP